MKVYTTLIMILCLSIVLVSCGQQPNQNKTAKTRLTDKQLAKYSQATFAAGCFWHEEALFESIKGVKEAVSGYAGGTTTNPTYRSIEEGNTGQTETVNVYYDPAVIDYATLVKIYFAGQDPTQANGQGPDHGSQYRSVLFYRSPTEKQVAESYMKQLQQSGKYDEPLAVEIKPLQHFYTAEPYHQNYIEHNPGSGYVNMVSIPEIKKTQKEFKTYVKPGEFY